MTRAANFRKDRRKGPYSMTKKIVIIYDPHTPLQNKNSDNLFFLCIISENKIWGEYFFFDQGRQNLKYVSGQYFGVTPVLKRQNLIVNFDDPKIIFKNLDHSLF